MSVPQTPNEFKQQIESEVRRLLPGHLQPRLRFASVPSVVALVLRRLPFTDLSPVALAAAFAPHPDTAAEYARWLEAKADEICRRTAGASYVGDCDRIAEYGSRRTRSSVRKQIQKRYWQEYIEWANQTLYAVLLRHVGALETEVCYGKAQDFVQKKAFAKEAFRRCAKEYEPEKGKTFEEFLKQEIEWRCLDAAAMVSKARVRCTRPADELPQVPAEERTLLDVARVQEALLECLKWLEGDATPRKAGLGAEERAVVELRHKAYLAPEFIAQGTKDLVRAASPGGIRRLRKEYSESLRRLNELVDEVLPARLNKLHKTFAEMDRCRADLDHQGHSAARLDELQAEALLSSIEDLDAAARRPRLGGGKGRDLFELAYMIASCRYQKAVRERERALEQWGRWLNLRLPWVRSEPEIAVLIGVSQPTVSNRLASAMDFFRGIDAGREIARR